jgi:hypothetical protein
MKISQIGVLPGDLILSRTNTLISKAIRFFESLQTQDAKYSHASMYIGNGLVIESLAQVRQNEIDKYNSQETRAWRLKDFTDEQRLQVAIFAMKQAGEGYGWLKIPLFALDAVATPIVNLGKKEKKPVYFFTKTLGITSFRVCSQFFAYCWYKVHKFDWGVDWRSVSPDYLDDFMQKTNQIFLYETEK